MRPAIALRGVARIAVTVVLALFLTGLPEMASARSITLVRAQPAQAMGGVPLRRIAIGDFRGQGGADVAAAVQAELSGVQSQGRPYFDLAQASTLGAARAAAAEAMLSADLQGRVDEEAFQGLGFGCIQGDGNGGCARAGLTTPDCMRRIYQLTLTPKLVRLADGVVVYSTPKNAKNVVSWCQGQPGPTSNQPAFEQAMKAIVIDLRRDLSPTDQKVKLGVKDSDRALPKERRDAFHQAIRAMSDHLTSACLMLQQLDTAAPQDPSVVFDLAVCDEASGDLSGAQRAYQHAQALNPPGDRDVAEATTRVAAALASQAEEARQRELVRSAQMTELKRQAEANAAQRAAEAAQQKKARADTQARQAADAARVQKAKAKYGAAAEPILKGRVEKGMTTVQVLAAKGQPSRREDLGGGDVQWYYPGLRVIFASGRVSYIGS